MGDCAYSPRHENGAEFARSLALEIGRGVVSSRRIAVISAIRYFQVARPAAKVTAKEPMKGVNGAASQRGK
jgi:hypothetical protein